VLKRRIGVLLGFTLSACFSGDATLGAVCSQDSDCGAGQTCTNEICGRCGDGAAQLGELCFEPGTQIDLGPDPVVLRPHDVDNDAVVDLVTLAPGAGELLVLRGNASGLSDPETVALPLLAQHLAVGDVDGDGATDALVADAESVWFGSGAGTLVFSFGDEALAWENASGLLAVPGSAVSDPFGVATRATANGETEVVALEIEAGATLRIGAGLTLPGELRVAASGQLLGDETPEIVLTAGPTITLVTGPELELGPELTLAADVVAVAIVDATGDGAADVLTADALGAVVVDAGDGEGGFVRREGFTLPGTVTAMVVGDLDRDGDRDIAAASDLGITLTLARGSGYGDTVALPSDEAATDVLVVSFGGDILPELIVSSATEGTVSVLGVRP